MSVSVLAAQDSRDLSFVVEPGLQENVVCPGVGVVACRQIALEPTGVLVRPDLL